MYSLDMMCYKPSTEARKQINIIHYVPSEHWYLLPFSITVRDGRPVSRCRQGKADASNALEMQ